MTVVDATATDGATTKDRIDFEAIFMAPDGQGEYRVVVKEAAPHGWFAPTAGGVITNFIQHGNIAFIKWKKFYQFRSGALGIVQSPSCHCANLIFDPRGGMAGISNGCHEWEAIRADIARLAGEVRLG